MFRSIGPPELLLILLVVLLLFGAKRLPDLSRSMARSLRIFTSEVKQMGDEDEDASAKPQTEGTAPRTDASQRPQELEGRVYRSDETPARAAPDSPVSDRPVPDPERRDT